EIVHTGNGYANGFRVTWSRARYSAWRLRRHLGPVSSERHVFLHNNAREPTRRISEVKVELTEKKQGTSE
ncbi:hypothetical protein TRIATDRAFT_302921, partial [Trichoderma atroviride IMI 206040]